MLEKIAELPLDTMNLVIFSPSSVLQIRIKELLKKRFGFDRYTTKYVLNAKDLKQVKGETSVQPFGGGLWLVDVDTRGVSIKDIGVYFDKSTQASLTVYWVYDYKTYKKILSLDKLTKMGRYCFTAYFGKLYAIDISFLHTLMLGRNGLSQELLNYVKKNYTYDVDAVCTLFDKMSKGEVIKKKEDIISLVGLGGNTVDSFVIKLLTTNPKTKQGIKSSFKKSLVLLFDLGSDMEYSTIRNFMLYSLETMQEIKIWQAQGLYGVVHKDIPEGYDEKRVSRLRRFEDVILKDIPLTKILNLRVCLKNYSDYDKKIAIIRGIMDYLGVILDSNELFQLTEEVQKNRK